ncbi:MAG TPA: sulfide/dihydroorotate dehydrogenase-like FAD/NAD-binding protein [Clostridiaceae bacterium]
MDIVFRDCIDSGSEYCPCKLAEAGKCLICSHLSGKDFCDCKNWKGVCIYNEFIKGGSIAKPLRSWENSILIDKKELDKNIYEFYIKISKKLAKELTMPGSFVLLRDKISSVYLDAPISVMEIEEDILRVIIEIKGVKTIALGEIKIGEEILVRGPYWNGILGIENIKKAIGAKVLLIARGIGEAPIIPIIKYLYDKGNTIECIIDKSPYKDIFVKEFLERYHIAYEEEKFMNNDGKLTKEFTSKIFNKIDDSGIELIHTSGPDILTYNVYKVCMDKGIKAFTSSNNAHICCGEGICGACSVKNEEFKVERGCKLQASPIEILEGRRLL